MKIYSIVFSPTGGTKKVADILSKAFGGEKEEIDLSRKDYSGCTLESDSIAVIAVPSFGGRAPKVAINRLKMIQGNQAKAVVVAVYGNRAQEDTMLETADAAKESGFQIIAGISAIAEHSIAHQYAMGRPNTEDQKQLEEFAKKIKERLETSQECEPNISGNHPYKKPGSGLVPKTTSACIDCGACALKCPVGAIDQKNPRIINKETCINCMRCVSICPQKAKKVNSFMVKLASVAIKKACSEEKQNELFC